MATRERSFRVIDTPFVSRARRGEFFVESSRIGEMRIYRASHWDGKHLTPLSDWSYKLTEARANARRAADVLAR